MTISSPGRSAAAIEREMWKVSVVMFGPRVMSSAATPRRSPIAACASSTIASDRSEDGKAPAGLAYDRIESGRRVLGPARAIEEDHRPVGVGQRQGRKPGANGVDVECSHGGRC